MGGVCFSRFLGPVAARFLLDFGGRDLYAGLQVMLCFLAAGTVYKTVALVYQGGTLLQPASVDSQCPGSKSET